MTELNTVHRDESFLKSGFGKSLVGEQQEVKFVAIRTDNSSAPLTKPILDNRVFINQ